MPRKLGEIASYLQGELVGDPSVEITGVAGIEQAKPGDLTFLANPKYKPFLEKTSAACVIVGKEIEAAKVPLIRHPNPYFAFSKAMELFFQTKREYPRTIHPTVVLGKGIKLGKGIHLGPYVVIEDNVELRENSTVLAGSIIEAGCILGENCLIYPHVTIRENAEIGKNVILHSGAVIGSDGFGYAKEKEIHHKIPQMGRVIIEDDVEIGACVTIDRATLGATRIGKGTKIDNLVQIGHNVVIGKNCIIVGQVGISGSTRIGNNVVLGGQAGLVGHIKIGNNVMIGAQSGVTKDIPNNTTIFGSPAREIKRTKKIEACISRLPEYIKRLRKIEEELKEIRRS
ncbi:MAG: UDP-3-O-(3-hydroxymyristoyl)glucosamine N-acyltransferase [Candidatus Zixiibacteriota bacterium]